MRRLNTPMARASDHPGDAVSEAQECGDRQRPLRLAKTAAKSLSPAWLREAFPSAVTRLCVVESSATTP